MLKNKKGQFTIVALIFVFVTLIIYLLGIHPILSQIIEDVTPDLDPTSALILQFVPALILFMIILSGLFYVIPQQQLGGQF